jgi:hypothetical protein
MVIGRTDREHQALRGNDALEWRAKVNEFVCVESLYAGSHQHSCNLTDMHWKALACIGLHVGTVPESYQ